MIRAYLFDLGGTLVDYSVGRWPAMFRRSMGAAYQFLVLPQKEQHPKTPIPSAEVSHALRSRPGWHLMPFAYRIGIGLRRMIRSISPHTLPQLAEALTRPVLSTG
ncbi:MAG: hypothetical protein QGD94_06840, partial [Planctomycetia bacterium]|nr:hypothetical protein [Planctomycetia bacterium]